jgi:hypothetical protein
VRSFGFEAMSLIAIHLRFPQLPGDAETAQPSTAKQPDIHVITGSFNLISITSPRFIV